MRLFGGARLVDYPCPANVARIDRMCIPMLVDMHQNGILIDKSHLHDISLDLESRLCALSVDIETLAGRPLNPNSGDQVAPLLFEELGVQGSLPLKMVPSRTRYSTDDETLSLLKDVHPLVGLILDYRELHKLKTTYVDALPRMARRSGRIHTTFRNTVAATGRLSSELPNLQNVPVRGDWGKPIRNAFMAGPGNVLASLDYAQIEMVVAAHLSGDEALRLVFWEEKDIHVETASAIFRVPPELVDKHTQRLPSKTLNYGVLYGVSEQGLQQQILANGGPWWSELECASFISDWFSVYPGVKEWMDLQHHRARRYGMVWDICGRWRLIPEVRSALQAIVNAGLRQSGNMPIQGSAQEIIKLAMAAVWPLVQEYRRKGKVCLPLLQIHDELLFELAEDIAEEFCARARRIMETVVPLSVPVRSSSDIAASWGALK